MNPVSLLRSGIEHGDWEDVVRAYSILTGDTLPVPRTEASNDPAFLFIEEFYHKARNVLNLDAPQPAAPSKPKKKQKRAFAKKKLEEFEAEVDEIVEAETSQPESPAKVDPFEKFKVNNNGPAGDKKYGRRVPYTPPKGPNKFKDDGKLAKREIAESRTLSEKKGPRSGPERPKFSEIDLTCNSCRRTFRVHPDLRPRKLDPQDNEPLWNCDGCIGRRRG